MSIFTSSAGQINDSAYLQKTAFMWSCLCCHHTYWASVRKLPKITERDLPLPSNIKVSVHLHLLWLAEKFHRRRQKQVNGAPGIVCLHDVRPFQHWVEWLQSFKYLFCRESCLLKLAASWSVAPCFKLQGFHLHKPSRDWQQKAKKPLIRVGFFWLW